MKNLDIGQVARRAGVPVSTLRFYEEKRLIASIGRIGLRRVFAASVLDRLALIAAGRAAGFSLEEVARIFTPDGKAHIDRKMLADKADELDGTIRKLTAIRDGLRHASNCSATDHMACPKFRRIVRVAAAGMTEARSKKARASARA